jgi:hypothetical protein
LKKSAIVSTIEKYALEIEIFTLSRAYSGLRFRVAARKLICDQVAPGAPRANINDYKAVLLQVLPDLPYTDVFVPRYGLSYRPWSNWEGDKNPDWWRSYNNVKHERDTYFNEATLKNSLNALGALLVLTVHYYSRKLAPEYGQVLRPKDTTRQLIPESTLLRLQNDNYFSHLIV